VAICYSGKEPDQLRGPQHDTGWADEIAKWQYAKEAWDNLELGLRLGPRPQVFITTTPRPIPIVKAFVQDPMIRVVTGSSYDNIANLADSFVARVIQKYEGTRLGQQELHAKLLGDVPNALFTTEVLERARVRPQDVPRIKRALVSIDPAMKKRRATTAKEQLDAMLKENRPNETGITAMGRGADKRVYLFEDASGEYSPREWGNKSLAVYDRWHATRMVAERNQGGDLVEANIEVACREAKRRMIHFRTVFAIVGKGARAEPVAAEMERGNVKLVGAFPDLEDQLTNLTPDDYLGVGSPDRADAFVHGATALLFGSQASTSARDYAAVQR
jgi:phage terminase large subunit-like protein